MQLLRHVRACNAHDPSRFRPLRIAGRPVGRLRDDVVRVLAGAPELRAAGDGGFDLVPDADGFDGRSAALSRLAGRLVAAGHVPKLRGEDYAVLGRWGEEPLAKADRGAVPALGLPSFGVHVNGLVRRPDGLHVWIGRRSMDRGVAPGKLDNLVAGGQPHGLSLAENLRKEGAEEAGLDAATMDRAVPVGVVSYAMDDEAGVRRDTLFLFDLELPDGLAPRNGDGEVERFDLVPAAEVLERVRTTDDFKFNVNLVVLDLMVRHGVLGPDEPGYAELCAGLATPPDGP
jgi:8-oxo-dGTP pyrophosphatase MutT (NUDIX family)